MCTRAGLCIFISCPWDEKRMRVLVACEFSGAVRDAFRGLGHDAWSCDLPGVEPEGVYKDSHIEGDVLHWLDNRWDLMVAHPPCTYLCNSGVRWLYNRDGTLDQERWDRMYEGALFFRLLLGAPIPRIAIENPIMHAYARDVVGRGHSQVVHPWWFGHPESKTTWLWLKGLKPLEPSMKVDASHIRDDVHQMSPSKSRSADRSRTYAGMARAMALQWGGGVA